MINKYETLADYDSAMSKQQLESSVSLIEDSNVTRFDGVNSMVSNPKIGDIACFDENKKLHFIARDTFKAWDPSNNVGFPQDWTTIGVVATRNGRKGTIAHKINAGKRWSAVFRWIVTGYESLTSGSYAVSIQGTNIGSLTGLDGTRATFITKFNELVQAARTASLTTQNAHMYWDEIAQKVYLIWDTYNAYPSGWSIASITLTAAIGNEINALSSLVRKNGVSTYWGGCNYARHYEYRSINGTPDPGHAVTTLDATVYNKTAFEAQANYEGSIYYMFDGSYDKYLEGTMVDSPFGRGVFDPEFDNGIENTKALAYVTYRDLDGNLQYLYTAARYAAYDTGYEGVKGFEVGDWYLPNIFEVNEVWKNLTYGLANVPRQNSDVINRSLASIGGSAIPVTSAAWSSSRYDAYYAWLYNNGGLINVNHFFYGFLAVPFAPFEL